MVLLNYCTLIPACLSVFRGGSQPGSAMALTLEPAMKVDYARVS